MRRCGRNNSSRNTSMNPSTISISELQPHLCATLFVTGAFATAWSWDLVFYSISHALAGTSPLQNQLTFVERPSPSVFLLLVEYLVVCGGAAVLSDTCRELDKKWSAAAIAAVEFVPSPVFAGKLMAYLSQFDYKLRTVEKGLLNLFALWFAASLAHFMPHLEGLNDTNDENTLYILSLVRQLRLQRFPVIVQNTLGFGLGIAWNVLLSQFAPASKDEWGLLHLIALATYLLATALIAFRLAADAKENPTTIGERQQALAAFSMYVVVAFTLVTFVHALLAPGIVGSLESFAVFLLLSAVMSAMVTKLDLEDASERIQELLTQGAVGGIFRCLIFVPCVWCCCPWILVVWLLAGNTENIGVKENWYRLIAMVSGLASSIEASGMLTTLTDALAKLFGICTAKHCQYKWLFVWLQTFVAILTTCVLLPAIALLPVGNSRTEPVEREETPETRSLLRRFRRRGRESSSSLR